MRPDPDPFSLAPGSPPSRPLRAASGGGLRPVLTAAARRSTGGQVGTKRWVCPIKQRDANFDLSLASPPLMTDLLNLTHTTPSRARACGRLIPETGVGLTLPVGDISTLCSQRGARPGPTGSGKKSPMICITPPCGSGSWRARSGCKCTLPQ